MTTPLLSVTDLVKHYTLPRERLFAPAPRVEALGGVSFEMKTGTSLGLVGESGSGKSTLARLVMALERPTSGRVRLLGHDLNALSAGELRNARRDFQMVFQDPYGSLDPRQTVGRIVTEPLATMPAVDARARVAEALDAVGLRATDADKYPHEFSGGQRQRIAIARALITRPRLIVADEPVSALDVSVQAQVLNLLQDLQQKFGVTYLLISHDLAVVDHLCDEVAVLYAGRIVEQGSPDVLFRAAAHPYTRALIEAVPRLDVRPAQLRAPSAAAMPASIKVAAEDGAAEDGATEGDAAKGGTAAGVTAKRTAAAASAMERDAAENNTTSEACSYAPRCPHRRALCIRQAPPLRAVAAGHFAACHFAEQVMLEVNVEEEPTP